jgi:hypothetical protein
MKERNKPMIARTTMIQEIILNDEELQAIEVLEPMLAELQNYFGTVNTLESVETGKLITGEEIARMRGVLEFLYTHRAVRVL